MVIIDEVIEHTYVDMQWQIWYFISIVNYPQNYIGKLTYSNAANLNGLPAFTILINEFDAS